MDQKRARSWLKDNNDLKSETRTELCALHVWTSTLRFYIVLTMSCFFCQCAWLTAVMIPRTSREVRKNIKKNLKLFVVWGIWHLCHFSDEDRPKWGSNEQQFGGGKCESGSSFCCSLAVYESHMRDQVSCHPGIITHYPQGFKLKIKTSIESYTIVGTAMSESQKLIKAPR